MLVGRIRGVVHDANVHRLSNRYSNRLSSVVIDEARRTFEKRIIRGLVHIELAKRFQGVVAAAFNLHGKILAPAPPRPYSPLRRPPVTVPAADKQRLPLGGAR